MTPHATLDAAREKQLTVDEMADMAVKLAEELLIAANKNQTEAERKQAAKIAGMMEDPNGKLLTMTMADQAFRSHNPNRINNQIRHLVEGYGVPHYFANWEQAALDFGTRIGQYIPHLVVPFVVAKLRQETSNVILPGEENPFKAYLRKRREGGTRLNLNHLGEAILGEDEAKRRLQAYLELLARPDVEYISVKISSIFSQINMVAFDATVTEIKERLRVLYHAAMKHDYVLPDGTKQPKFINLDMEEYRDLHMTVAAFQQVLDEDEFFEHRAGIVLQAYLPDSFAVQQQLTEWAKDRTARGGAPIKVRIVKGANLAMERVEAAMHGWEQAPYYTKADVDANFKRMVLYGCEPENAPSVNLGIASHNLFDIAFGLVVQANKGVGEHIEFEMLEGMANHQARTVQDVAGGLLLYAPVVKQNDFHSAIAYLVRRLDENTAEENFLHDIFDLKLGSDRWNKQREFFLSAIARRAEAPAIPNRKQNRQTEQPHFDPEAPFANEPDTDFSLRENQAWAKAIAEAWQNKTIDPIPLQIGGELSKPNTNGIGVDPSRPEIDVAYRYALAEPEQVEAALQVAVETQSSWRETPVEERKRLLVSAAQKLAERRGDLIGAAMLDGGKTVEQADVEVSEAIDFANYYARSLDDEALSGNDFSPLGTVLITPPWNFPIAIPCGGMLAALMAGNTVILKPAPEVVLIGWELINALWDAGIPREALQFVPTTDDAVGKSLVTDERVDAVILTGAYETARLFLGWKPSLRLFAETSGKNSMIITALADHDQAIKDLVYSAFGHNGQKCSAASLAVLEAEVYDNPAFRRQLKDAAQSLHVGPAWDISSKVTPLIREPGDALERAQTTLEPGEEWLLEPQKIHDNLWTPGIKLGVKRGSFYHKTECFGPVLGLMRAQNLKNAIDIVNDSDFGLTSGLHSLDDREVSVWRERIEVGNAYINRGTTGAIVQRQPFGGWKRSAFGPGAKAGGPNYVLSLGTWADDGAEDYAESYQKAWDTHFGVEHDPSEVLGESNVFRYRPLKVMAVYATATATEFEVARARVAAQTCNVPLAVFISPESDLTIAGAQSQTEAEFAAHIEDYERVRFLGTPSNALYEAAHEHHVPIIDAPVTSNGRLELRYYLREQAMTETLHRYGNIVPKPSH